MQDEEHGHSRVRGRHRRQGRTRRRAPGRQAHRAEHAEPAARGGRRAERGRLPDAVFSAPVAGEAGTSAAAGVAPAAVEGRLADGARDGPDGRRRSRVPRPTGRSVGVLVSARPCGRLNRNTAPGRGRRPRNASGTHLRGRQRPGPPDPPGLDVVAPVTDERHEGAVIALPVVEHLRRPGHIEIHADLPGDLLGPFREVLVADRETVQPVPGRLNRLDVHAHLPYGRAKIAVGSVVDQAAHHRRGVAQQEDVPGLRPARRQPLPEARVAGCLVHDA